MKTYELRIAFRAWGTTCCANNVREAIKSFILDPLYRFPEGKYTIEVRGYKKFFHITKKDIITHKVIFR